MNTSDALILEFIDRTLDPEGEQQLFALMAAHPEMREALRQHISIGEAVRADRVAYAPPASLEMRLFQALDLAPAPTAAATVAWWRGGIGTTVSGMVIGVVATLLLLGTGESERVVRNTIEPTIATVTTGHSIAAAIPGLPRATVGGDFSSPGATVVRSIPSAPRVVEKIRYIERPGRQAASLASNGSEPVSSVGASAPVQLHQTSPQAASPSAANEVLSVPATPLTAVSLAASSPLEDAVSLRSPFTVELRRSFGNKDMASVPMGNARQSLFENTAGAVYYNLTDSFAVGVEGGYERYAQVLRPSVGDTLMIEQRPAYLWGGATFRYIPGAIPGTAVRPLFQGTIGATGAGPLVRGRLGASLALGEAFGLNAGFEVGTLFYQYNGETLASGRWGLTTGIEFKLP